MNDQLFYLEPRPGVSLQMQIQEMLVSLILEGHLAPGSQLPSSRRLSQDLKVSRNTVTLVYARLTDEGYLISQEREGHFVNPDLSPLLGAPDRDAPPPESEQHWLGRFKQRPSRLPFLDKPRNWRQIRFPFIYGQLDARFFPAAEWRECSRQANSSAASRQWFVDSYDADDPQLLEQLRNRVLPRRGIRCREEEILVTMGTQNSLYLLSRLLMNRAVTVGLETPGYLDAYNTFSLTGAKLKPLTVDRWGIAVDGGSRDCDYLFVTPSHQYPTTVTMPMTRRKALLQQAAECDQIIIEDDYEFEINFKAGPTPALKSLDRDDRVLYVGSLSKTLAPGLRMGYLVGPPTLIKEARALRRLLLRHPPANNQRALALFLAGGYHDSLVRRLTGVYRERRRVLLQSLAEYLPQVRITDSDGGSSLWCQGPAGFDATQVQHRALKYGVFIEAMAPVFFDKVAGTPFFRLGFSAIPSEDMEEAVQLLARAVVEVEEGG